MVGAGVGGCVATAELAAAGRQVLLVEAGPGEPRPDSVLGLDAIAAAEEPRRQWPDLRVRAKPLGADRRYRQGYGVGGGSQINSMLLSPGDSRDYHRWQQQFGCAGWGPEEMTPYLHGAADRFVGTIHQPESVSLALIDAAAAAGHTVGGSTLEQDRLGVLQSRLAAADGRRVSAVEAYLKPATETAVDGRITVRAGRAVRRVLVEGDKAVGVEMHDGNRERAPIVIVAAGAIRSPLLLAESGLKVPGLGQGFRDHPSFSFTLSLTPDASPVEGDHHYDDHDYDDQQHHDDQHGVNVVSHLLRWSSGQAEHGDLQAFAIDRVGTTEGQNYAAAVVGLMRPTSSGSVSLSSAGSTNPTVVTGMLGSDSDRARFRAGVLHVLDLLRSCQSSSVVDEIYIDERGTTAAALEAMDEPTLDRFLAHHPGPFAHPAGTCAMGPDGAATTVVSCEPETAGLVVGTHGLYVADASVMPDLVQGGLQLPVAAIAVRVAKGIAFNH